MTKTEQCPVCGEPTYVFEDRCPPCYARDPEARRREVYRRKFRRMMARVRGLLVDQGLMDEDGRPKG